jgi:hypothetical protein
MAASTSPKQSQDGSVAHVPLPVTLFNSNTSKRFLTSAIFKRGPVCRSKAISLCRILQPSAGRTSLPTGSSPMVMRFDFVCRTSRDLQSVTRTTGCLRMRARGAAMADSFLPILIATRRTARSAGCLPTGIASRIRVPSILRRHTAFLPHAGQHSTSIAARHDRPACMALSPDASWKETLGQRVTGH